MARKRKVSKKSTSKSNPAPKRSRPNSGSTMPKPSEARARSTPEAETADTFSFAAETGTAFEPRPCLNSFGSIPSDEEIEKIKAERKRREEMGDLESFGLPREGLIWEESWKKNPLTVSFVEPEPISGLIDAIKTIAPKWLEDTDMSFDFRGVIGANADIRVKFSDQGKYYSVIGIQSAQASKSGASMNLGFDSKTFSVESEKVRLILHEFGHALGLDHEHKQKDMDLKIPAAVEYYRRNGLAGYSYEQIRYQFEKLKENEIDSRATEFDPDSVMLYPFPADVAPPNGTGVNSELSAKDKEVMQKLYGAGANLQPGPAGMELSLDPKARKRAYYLFGKDTAVFYFRTPKKGDYEIVISSDSSDDVIDPFGELPKSYFQFDIQSPLLMLDAKFEVYPEDTTRNFPGKKLLKEFTVKPPDADVDENAGFDPPPETLSLDKGLYFVKASIQNANDNEPCRFVIQIRPKN